MQSVSNYGFESFDGKEICQYLPWKEKGILHGFTCCSFGDLRQSENREVFKTALGLENLFTPTQEHTDSALSFKQGEDVDLTSLADAIILSDLNYQNNIAIGVLTADCVPLLLKDENYAVVIHAGWQGLANQIIVKTLSQIKNSLKEPQILVGPAGGLQDYQVGAEVIEQIGASAVYDENQNGFYLDLAETAVNQVESVLDKASISSLNICTITSNKFYSFREQQDKAGRFLSYLIV